MRHTARSVPPEISITQIFPLRQPAPGQPCLPLVLKELEVLWVHYGLEQRARRSRDHAASRGIVAYGRTLCVASLIIRDPY